MRKDTTDDDGLTGQLVSVFGHVQLFHLQLHTGLTEAFYLFAVPFIGKIADDAFGNARPDFIHLHQFVQRSLGQCIDATESFRQGLGGSFAHKADAQSKQHPFERHFKGRTHPFQDVQGRLLAHTFQAGNVRCLQSIEVGNGMNQSFLIELVDGFRAKPINIHRLPADKMLDFSLDLRRTGRIVGAIMGCFTFIACQRATTFGTLVDEAHLIAHQETGIHIHAYNLRDDFASLFHIHHIADVEVKPLDDVGIVQGSPLHHRTGQLHGVEIGHRSDGSRTTYLISHLIQASTCSFGLKFISDGPSG